MVVLLRFLPCQLIILQIVKSVQLSNTKKVLSIEIHRQLVEVYSKVVMSDENVCKWYKHFNERRTNVHDEE